MKSASYAYQPFGISEVPAPVLTITISDLLGEHSVMTQALVDTGYDGYLIVPMTIYDQAGLTRYEIDLDQIPWVETLGGERMAIRSANGMVRIAEITIDLLCEIDTHERCSETLVGRQLLTSFFCGLDGPGETLSLELTATVD